LVGVPVAFKVKIKKKELFMGGIRFIGMLACSGMTAPHAAIQMMQQFFWELFLYFPRY